MSCKARAVHDCAKREIRYTCARCGSVEHIENPDPFELLSLYQGGMEATCGACRTWNKLELREVLRDE